MVFIVELHMYWVASASDIGVFQHGVLIKLVTPSSMSITQSAGSINVMVTGGGGGP